MNIVNFYNNETKTQIFRLTTQKPINSALRKYLWLKKISLAVDKLSKDKEIPKAQITVEDLTNYIPY